jgi:hypothetical protein
MKKKFHVNYDVNEFHLSTLPPFLSDLMTSLSNFHIEILFWILILIENKLQVIKLISLVLLIISLLVLLQINKYVYYDSYVKQK